MDASTVSVAHDVPNAIRSARELTQSRVPRRHPRGSWPSLPSRIASRLGARAGELGIVCSDDNGGTVAAREPGEELDHVRAGLGVEVAGGLVGEDHARPDDEGARDRDALLLAT